MKFTQRKPTKVFRNYYKFLFFLIIYIFINNLSAQDKLNWIDISLVDTIEYVSFDVSNVVNTKYPPSNLFDSKLNTCWVNSSDKTSKSSLYLKLPESDNIVINIFSGYGKSKVLHSQNARPKKLKFTIFAAVNPDGYVSEIGTQYKAFKFQQEQIVNLADNIAVQSIPLYFLREDLIDFASMVSRSFDSKFKLPKADECLILQTEILETFEGTKYNDVCISEIFFNDRFISPGPAPKNNISKVYTNQDENTILVDTKAKQGNIIYSEPSSVLQIIEVSKNKKWAIAISMPAEIQGRVETKYLLVDLVNRKIVNSQLEKSTGNYYSGNEMYFETANDNVLYLLYNAKDGKYYKLELK